jgi:hypothetical protein
MNNKKDIRYLNKDFTTFKSDLIEYARAYFPTTYNDFSQASPGSMFIEMASYVGDVLSFYLDNQLQETFLQYAKQKNNLFTMAYMMGYRPRIVGSALVDLDVYQVVTSFTSGGLQYPNFSDAMVLAPGMTVASNVNGTVSFYVPEKVDFTVSSSLNPTEVTVYQLAGNIPNSFLLKKRVKAVSGQLKAQSFSIGSAKRYQTLTINEPDIVSIISITDSDGNKWYEVPYLAQDYIDNPVENTAASYPNLHQYSDQVPYILEKIKVDRRFTTRFQTNETLVIEFGPGINEASVSDIATLPNPFTASLGNFPAYSTMFTAYDPTNFLTTKTYGLAPYNIDLTVQYLVGGGAQYNVLSNQLTKPSNLNVLSGNSSFLNTVITNNENPASGGGDGDTVEEIRQNTLAQFMSQDRAVTQQDYLQKAVSMPAKYGKISKAYVTKDDLTLFNYTANDVGNTDAVLVTMYVLGLNSNNNLGLPSEALLQNLKTYLSDYRMLTDSINIKPAYIINIGCNFDIIIRPNYNSQDVIARCLVEVKKFFAVDNWQINEPIVLNDLYTIIDMVEGVQTVKNIQITNNYNGNYSPYAYDIPGATLDDIIYPSLDPSIFEVKFPDSDIKGRVITL